MIGSARSDCREFWAQPGKTKNIQLKLGFSQHNNFWDFAGLKPETTHMLCWIMSDRAIPRSYRMMQGFGVNTFTLINASSKRVFVKFHWLPELGVHSLVWDEALKIAGQDPGSLKIFFVFISMTH